MPTARFIEIPEHFGRQDRTQKAPKRSHVRTDLKKKLLAILAER
jgi:hypothetical protein